MQARWATRRLLPGTHQAADLGLDLRSRERERTAAQRRVSDDITQLFDTPTGRFSERNMSSCAIPESLQGECVKGLEREWEGLPGINAYWHPRVTRSRGYYGAQVIKGEYEQKNDLRCARL